MILMDIQMPVKDGFSATQLIRQHEIETGTHIIIVALSANRAENIREQCLQAGMDDFAYKPITLAKMNQLLAKWLKASRFPNLICKAVGRNSTPNSPPGSPYSPRSRTIPCP